MLSVPTTFAVFVLPSLNVTLMESAPEMTWLLVMISPSLVMITPEPVDSPPADVALISTTLGLTAAATADTPLSLLELALITGVETAVSPLSAAWLIEGRRTAAHQRRHHRHRGDQPDRPGEPPPAAAAAGVRYRRGVPATGAAGAARYRRCPGAPGPPCRLLRRAASRRPHGDPGGGGHRACGLVGGGG